MSRPISEQFMKIVRRAKAHTQQGFICSKNTEAGVAG